MLFRRIGIWLVLVAAHLGVGAWGSLAGSDRVGAVAAGSIYLPLWPFAKLGMPVFQRTGWFFPPPTALGWLIAIAFWMIVHWYVAALAVRPSVRHSPPEPWHSKGDDPAGPSRSI